MNSIPKFYAIIALVLLVSCSHKKNFEQKAEAPVNMITVSKEQFENGRLSIGEPVRMAFEEVIRCNGNIVAEPSGSARISTLVTGIVKKINCIAGQKVFAGQVLFELYGNEFIELQKDLAETESQLMRIRSEYERIRSLYNERVGTEKELILAESEFRASNAKYSALKMKIKYLGLEVSKIENGDFYESFSLKSPLNGYISLVKVSVGQYADLQTTFAEIFDAARLQLKIAVFEKDIPRLKENQSVKFNLLGGTGDSFTAILKSIGKNVDNESKNITCYASIDDIKSTDFVNNAYVEAVIITKNDTVNAVPEESVLKSEGNSYILEFVKNENDIYYLKRTRVDIGRLRNGFAEILNGADVGKIIARGAYNIVIE